MRKALMLGAAASFFFAFTFILNRSMNLGGGDWMWSACLRYLFTLPMLAAMVWPGRGIGRTMKEIGKAPGRWILWSTVGFGLFYAPLTLGSVYGESWLAAACWQMTIVAGVLLTPLFGKKIPVKNLALSMLILLGIFLMQLPNLSRMDAAGSAEALLPVLVAAFAYPLGNRKMMELCGSRLTTIQRVFGMTLCSMPFWLLLSAAAWSRTGLPSAGQTIQSVCVAFFSGVAATVLFFRATDMVRHDQRKLALIEATQCGEVLFTLLGGILLLGDSVPAPAGLAGIGLIVAGMVLNSLAAA
ncbi:MAG: multidrug resistance efflux transporter family protein [Eubacteriales bacterium]|nr:multidrug resistance efflux transporter family protein [Eubacteriales bacterium]